MTAVAKFSEVFILAFCTLFLPKDAKEMMVTGTTNDAPGDTLKVVKTDKGFDLFSYHDETRVLLTLTASKDNPSGFTFKFDDKSQQVDIGEAQKQLKPPADEPSQEIKVNEGKIRVQKRGNAVFLNFEGVHKTYVLHGTAPQSAANSGPSSTTQPSATPPAASQPAPAGAEAAGKFWAALAAGDAAAMKAFYAEKVAVKAGSELLKKEYALDENADRGKDLTVDREKLIAAYARMIGQDRKDWTDALGRFRTQFVAATQEGNPFNPVRSGDLVLMASDPGGRDDKVVFVFRQNEKGQWLVVAERADY